MFTIVEFTLSKEVEIVPKTWLTKDAKCWWPNFTRLSKVNSAVQAQQEPSADTFTLYPIRVLKHYGERRNIKQSICVFQW